MRPNLTVRLGRMAYAATLLVTAAGCAPVVQQLPSSSGGWDTVHSYCPEPASTSSAKASYRKWRAGSSIPRPRWGPVALRFYPAPRGGKIDPPLRRRLARYGPLRAAGVRETLLVTFRETLRIPAFPALVETQPRASAANVARLAAAQVLVAEIAAARDSLYDADSLDLTDHLGATILHRHWLTRSMLVSMPLASVPALAARPHVVYVQARVGADPPPSCPPTGSDTDDDYDGDDPQAAQELMRLDAYRALGLDFGYLSLVDTGVWTGHAMLVGAALGVAGDCVNGGADCVTTSGAALDPGDQCDKNLGHGTSSAALLVGDASVGDRWRGALDATLDHFQVYVPGDCGNCDLCLDADAVCHAFETAVSNLDRVIVAEVASTTPERAAIGMNANNAFHAGAVVVAANGNGGAVEGNVTSPASAPCAIGVGARDMLALDGTDPYQSLGPASGGRIKPDVQAPTGTETAALRETGCARTDVLKTHTGTSGSTPYAGAAAVLLRNWLEDGDRTVLPGVVNAALILSGRHYGAALNNTEGAGLLELPTAGCAFWGVALARSGRAWTIPLDLGEVEADSIEAALWWPEDPAVDGEGDGVTRHNNVDLYLVEPGGSASAAAAKSVQAASVFERATAAIDGRTGTWTVEIRGEEFYDPAVTQLVYWIAVTRQKR